MKAAIVVIATFLFAAEARADEAGIKRAAGKLVRFATAVDTVKTKGAEAVHSFSDDAAKAPMAVGDRAARRSSTKVTTTSSTNRTTSVGASRPPTLGSKRRAGTTSGFVTLNTTCESGL